jgi:hypothetical protein
VKRLKKDKKDLVGEVSRLRKNLEIHEDLMFGIIDPQTFLKENFN